MIKKISIKKNGVVTNAVQSDLFDSVEDFETFVAARVEDDSWGKKAHWLRPETVDAIIPEHFTDSREVEIDGQTVTEYFYPAEYEMVETDITEEVAAQNAKRDTRSDREFCTDMVDEIAAHNKQSATDSTVLTLFQDIRFLGIIVALMSGGGKQAKELMSIHGPELYPEDIVLYFVNKLDERFPS